MVAHKCRRNIATLFRKPVKGSVQLIGTFKCNLLRRSTPEAFLEKAVLNICSKFAGENPYRSKIYLLHFSLSVFVSFFVSEFL